MDNDYDGQLVKVASSRSMESFVEREVKDIVASRKKGAAINSSRAGNSRETPRSGVRFDLPLKKIKTKERSPDTTSIVSRKSKLSSHGLKLTKMLKNSLRNKVKDHQRKGENVSIAAKGKDKLSKKKTELEATK